MMFDKFQLTLAALLASLLLCASCGGGGGGSTQGAPTVPSAPVDPNPPISPPPASSRAIVNVDTQIAKYTGSYIENYRFNSSNVFGMTYNLSANELIVVGNLLPGGLPGIQGLDPVTFNVRWSIPTALAGDTLAVSGDGSKLYTGTCQPNRIVQIDLTKKIVEKTFAIGTPDQQVCATSLAVRPGHPKQVAAALTGYGGLVPREAGVAMYDDGQILPDNVSPVFGFSGFVGNEVYVDASKIAFASESLMFGASYLTSEIQTHAYTVTNSGIKLQKIYRQVGGDGDFQIVNDKLFFRRGYVYPTPEPLSIQRNLHCEFPTLGYAIADPSGTSQVCIASVPSKERRNSRKVELDIQVYPLQGERLKNWSRIDLSAIAPIFGLATAEVDILNAIAMPNGQLAINIRDIHANRFMVVGITLADLDTVSAPQPRYEEALNGGLKTQWANVPVTGTAFNTVNNTVLGIVPGTYGPNGSSLVTFDGVTKRVLDFIQLDREALAVAISKDGNYAYAYSLNLVEQVDLRTRRKVWNWLAPATEGITSVAISPTDSTKIVVSTDRNLTVVSQGLTRSQLPRIPNGGSSNIGFIEPTSLMEVSQPNSPVIYSFNGTTLAKTREGAEQFGGGGPPVVYFDFGLAFSPLGIVFDVSTLSLARQAPSVLSLITDPTANGLGVRGFTATSANHFVVARLNSSLDPASGTGIVFEDYAQTTLSSRFEIRDKSDLLGKSLIQMTPMNTKNFVLGQADQYRGQGALFFVQIKP